MNTRRSRQDPLKVSPSKHRREAPLRAQVGGQGAPGLEVTGLPQLTTSGEGTACVRIFMPLVAQPKRPAILLLMLYLICKASQLSTDRGAGTCVSTHIPCIQK